MDLYNFYTVYM